MATERLPMRHTREILRQKWVLGCTHRAVANPGGRCHFRILGDPATLVTLRLSDPSVMRDVGSEMNLL